MKRLSVLFFLLISFTFSAYSQQGKIEFSPEYKLANNKHLAGHLHSNSSGHYMYFRETKGLMGGRTNFILEKYDRKYNQVFSKKFKTSKKEVYGKDIKYFKSKFAWLMYERDFKKNEFNYFLTPIDLDGNSSKPKRIARFKYKTLSEIPKTSWRVSKDTSKILFIAQSDRGKKKENYEVYLSVIDQEFNEIWDKKVVLPFSQRRVEIKSWELSNDGKIYFVAKIYEDNKTKESKNKKTKGKRKKTPAYDIVIYTLDSTMSKPKKYELELKDAFVKGVKLRVGESDDLACVGFFGDSKFGPTQGVFYLKLSATDGATLFANKRRFKPKELDAFGDKNTSKDKKSKDSGLDASFKFDEIVILDNGEIFATAEESYSYVVTSYSPNGGSSSTTYYVSNSIVVINISQKGEVRNVGIIPKRQTMKSTAFQSYATLRTDNQVFFIYNDDKDNLKKNITDPDKIKRISSAKDFVAVMTTLEGTNKLNRKALFTKKEAKTLLMPSKSKQISGNQLFFFNSKAQFLGKNRFRFGTLTIEE